MLKKKGKKVQTQLREMQIQMLTYFKEILMKELIFTKEANKIISGKKKKNLRDTLKILKINITETIIETSWAE